MKKLLALVVALAMALTLVACGNSASNNGSASGEPSSDAASSTSSEAASSGESGEVDLSEITIAYVPTTLNNPFWTAMMGGIKDQMTALGMDPETQLITVDADSDQVTMNNYVNDLINQEVDAIILAPMDCTAVTEALEACQAAGIPVINVDTAVDRTDLVVSVIGSTAIDVAVAALQGEEVEPEIVIDVTLITTDNCSEFDISDWQ